MLKGISLVPGAEMDAIVLPKTGVLSVCIINGLNFWVGGKLQDIALLWESKGVGRGSGQDHRGEWLREFVSVGWSAFGQKKQPISLAFWPAYGFLDTNTV